MKKRLLCTILTFILALTSISFVFGLENGTYVISKSTSYAHPETGSPVDGGTNIALGDSMCQSIVENQMLLEKNGNSTYLTIGLGLMSNVSNVTIQIVDQNNNYRTVSATKTGSCTRNGDTCNHYRFEWLPTDKYVSPIIYVEPMGRDVQFFVTPNINSAVAGTGNFGAGISSAEPPIPAASEQSASSEVSSTDSDSKENVKSAEKKEEEKKTKDHKKNNQKKAKNDREQKEEKSLKGMYIATGAILLILVVGGTSFIIYKRKRG